jgi:hypothetical protein
VSPALVIALLGCATVAPRGEGPAPVTGAGQVFSEADLPDTDAPPPRETRLDAAAGGFDLQARLAVRARSYLGRRGPFRAKGQRFGSDCSGFVEAVYAAEGILLRDLMQRAAPEERGGVKAAWLAVRQNGRVFGRDEWPAPGDLVFWNDTYDRNRNRRADDRFTHLGIVEYVEDGTVYFLHRGGRGVARGVMTPGRPTEATDADGRKLNSAIRATRHPVKDGGLAGALLAGYGRIDLARVPREYASRQIDPFFGPPADREASPEEPSSAPGQGAASTSPAPASPTPAATPTAGMTATPAAKRSSTRAAIAGPSPGAALSRGQGTAASPSKRAGAASPLARKKFIPARKVPPQKTASKKALARAKPLATKGRTAARKAAPLPAQRAETAAAGDESVPSSETRSAPAPKSSSESRRNTGTTEPAGSR